MDLGLTGRTALVCGASSGLGLASAEALAEEGANVVLFARRTEKLSEHADHLAHSVGGLPQRFLLGVVQLDLEDLLDALSAELHGDAHVEAVDPVLALEVGGAGQHTLLVEHHRVDHLR